MRRRKKTGAVVNAAPVLTVNRIDYFLSIGTDSFFRLYAPRQAYRFRRDWQTQNKV